MLDSRFPLALPRLDRLRPDQIALTAATRHWAAAAAARDCPMRAAHDRLGCGRSARGLHLLLAYIGSCWPEPFAVSAPGSSCLTHDEATLLVMIEAARDHRRPVFDALLCEMLDQDARDRLYDASKALARSIAS